MSTAPATAANAATITVALIGNPNTGKSTLFNALSGVKQQVGNYPGVTVEKKVGHARIEGRPFAFIDLPGTYSLAPRSPDEMVTVDVLLGRRADVDSAETILCIVDASNLERNLYLVSQVLELQRPTVLALNMIDVAAAKGVTIDVARLQRHLGIPVVAVQANKKSGLAELKAALAETVDRDVVAPESPFPTEFQAEVADLSSKIAAATPDEHIAPPRFLIERLLLDTGGYLETHTFPGVQDQLPGWLAAARARLAQADCQVPAVEAISRYGWVARMLEGVVRRPVERRVTAGDKVDRYLTHKWLGPLIFAALMIAMFQAVFSIAEPVKNGLDFLKGAAADGLEKVMPEGALRSLLIDGVIEGVGSVITFLPQIAVLFLFIAVLEDCGYMARAAYLMDRLMVPAGLSGKSFIPLLSSFACAVPGVMATRVIENRRDRLATMLVAPLMSCSARIPVYTLFTAAFLPDVGYLGGWLSLRSLTMFGLYLLGIVVAMAVAFVLKKTVLKGETPPFVMELPNYKRPALGTIAQRIFDRSWAFLYQAGTVIFAVAILVWAAGYYPRDKAAIEGPYERELADIQAKLDAMQDPSADADVRLELHQKREQISNEIAGEYQRHSLLGRAGQLIEPAVKPLGWDWRIGCAVIASFPAREVVIATLGVIYNQGRGVDAESQELHETLRQATWDGTQQPVFNVPVALSIMVFFALCAQCVSTLAVIKRETNTWRWPVFTFVYMTALAYIGAWATYHVGMLFV